MKFIHKHEKCPDYKDVDAIIAWHRNEIDCIQAELDSTRKELEELRGKVEWYIDCCDTLRWYNDMYDDDDFYFEPWAMRSIQNSLHNAEHALRAAV